MILALCMYGKMQESGLTEIIPLMCILAILGQNAPFLHPESPQGMQSGGFSGWWLAVHSILCLLIWQEMLFFFKFIYWFGYVGVLAAEHGILAESCDLFCAMHGPS